MSTTPSAAPVHKRTSLRVRFPWLVLGLAGLAIALLWAWPNEALERAWQVVGTEAVLLLTFLLLLGWMLFFSRWPGKRRLAIFLIVLAAGGAAAASISEVSFTGDMVPRLVFRWTTQHDEVLEQHRREQAKAPLDPVFITDLPRDFPEYRGRRRDGVVTGPALERNWTAAPPRLLWKQPVGGGYAAFAVAGNLAVTIEQRRDHEVVAAYDTATGRERWTHAYPALFREGMGGNGPRATPTIVDGHVYSLGATGKLLCLDAQTGKVRWEVEVLADNDNLHWGMSGSPLVYDEFVVVSPGKQRPRGNTLVAYDRTTGQKLWASGAAPAGYSSPMLATLAGRRQVLLLDGDSMAGYDARTGQELWRFAWETNQGINVAQPLVLDGDRVFVSSGYGVGCAVLQIEQTEGKWSARVVWRNRAMRCKFTSPVAYQSHLYGLDEGVLVCLDEKTGNRQWRDGRYGHGQLLRAHDLLVILAESGELALVAADPAAYRELGRIPVFADKTWNSPALADGKAYLRNDQDMACYDLRAMASR
jgi:outer membrane protein assembly factor BamB